MGKRSTFERIERDFYPTPPEAVLPLLPHLAKATRFVEPCAGDGALVRALQRAGHICSYACDIEPRLPSIPCQDALNLSGNWQGMTIITNPPWSRDILHRMISRFADCTPTWLLFDADWMHTKQAADYLPMCSRIVSVGRIKWIANSPHTGKDNCAWYRFDKSGEQTTFYGYSPDTSEDYMEIAL